ncbi:MAG: 4-hydroxy-tetrahydrodipicolinate reductase [candidate division WOR-3 bacterium]|nr:4-hydroxy-tetrahydrodipicolinate reductase [candidate division WOR-3 bacterium]
MIKVILVGACGKMSSALVSAISQEKDIKIVAGIEASGHPLIGTPIGIGFIQDNLSKVIHTADIVVEFAIPEITLDNVKIAANARKPYIIGTTGLKDIDAIKKYSKKIPILISANFSLGINLLYKLTEISANFLRDFDIVIVESHHKMKRDAPSGTAKNLAEIIRKTDSKNQEVKIHSIRAGDIVGEHTVMFTGKGERLELVHRATNRNAFASGVLKAIRFLVRQKPRFFGMDDIFLTKPTSQS